MASSARAIASVPFTSGLDGSIDIRATLVIDATARTPPSALVTGTIFVPGFSGAKLFLLHTGIFFSASGASVRGCSTLAPL